MNEAIRKIWMFVFFAQAQRIQKIETATLSFALYITKRTKHGSRGVAERRRGGQ